MIPPLSRTTGHLPAAAIDRSVAVRAPRGAAVPKPPSPAIRPPSMIMAPIRHRAGGPTSWRRAACVLAMAALAGCGAGAEGRDADPAPRAARVPGTGLTACFDDAAPMPCPARGAPYAGQDGSAPGPLPAFRDNGDGSVTDLNTGLTWTRALSSPASWSDATAAAASLRTGGHTDWRLPTIKELYTLMDFGRGYFSTNVGTSVPFLDTAVFDFAYSAGARYFDVQQWSATAYVATTMNNDATVFGVNFADGRIKGYPRFQPGSGTGQPTRMHARYVRGAPYGLNAYTDQGNGTVSDAATGLVWQKTDDGVTRNWRAALAYCDQLDLGGARDWRLPDAKELHTIVDYGRAPATSSSAAVAPPLQASKVESYFWTSTTISDGPPDVRYGKAVYFAFGRALGWMEMPPGSGRVDLIDVHGAGAQRADFKSGDPQQYPRGFGPQGDDVRIANHVRCVRGGR